MRMTSECFGGTRIIGLGHWGVIDMFWAGSQVSHLPFRSYSGLRMDGTRMGSELDSSSERDNGGFNQGCKHWRQREMGGFKRYLGSKNNRTWWLFECEERGREKMPQCLSRTTEFKDDRRNLLVEKNESSLGKYWLWISWKIQKCDIYVMSSIYMIFKYTHTHTHLKGIWSLNDTDLRAMVHEIMRVGDNSLGGCTEKRKN